MTPTLPRRILVRATGLACLTLGGCCILGSHGGWDALAYMGLAAVVLGVVFLGSQEPR